MMSRREFITLLGGAAASWPLAARAQQAPVPTIGYLHVGSPDARVEAAFRKGLSEIGFVEGRNVAIEFRYAENQFDRLPALAAELVRQRVAVIFAGGGAATVPAAKAATTTIPIVFSTGADPVQTGMVASFNRPGGNVTGISSMTTELTAKRLELLRELLPGAAHFAVLVNPNVARTAASVTADAQTASTIGRQVEVFTASTSGEINSAFDSMVQ
jgi:putative ABC transport system substrate-binding protein